MARRGGDGSASSCWGLLLGGGGCLSVLDGVCGSPAQAASLSSSTTREQPSPESRYIARELHGCVVVRRSDQLFTWQPPLPLGYLGERATIRDYSHAMARRCLTESLVRLRIPHLVGLRIHGPNRTGERDRLRLFSTVCAFTPMALCFRPRHRLGRGARGASGGWDRAGAL